MCLRRAYALLKEHYELLRRQIFAARAERVDATQLELDFAETKARLEAMATLLEEAAADAPDAAIGPDAAAEASEACSDAAPPPSGEAPPATKPKGRRNLRDEDLPEVRIELTDPELEGIAERIGFESTYKLGYRRAGPVRIVVACATYKTTTSEDDEAEFTTVPMPKEMVDRGLLAPSVIARILTSKYCFGIPFNRLAKMFRAEGVKVDDSMMCRYAEHVGATLGCIVDACAADAKENAFCLSTDATGVAIQPAAIPGRPRQACSKGHFFVVLADRDHIFFEYQRDCRPGLLRPAHRRDDRHAYARCTSTDRHERFSRAAVAPVSCALGKTQTVSCTGIRQNRLTRPNLLAAKRASRFPLLARPSAGAAGRERGTR